MYIFLAKEKDWNFSLPGLVLQAKSQATKASTSQWPDMFNQNTFIEYLWKFIVVDDQICFHLSFDIYNAHVCMFRLSSL